jgi:hypothetical protein
MIYSILSFKPSGAGVATFSGKVCSIASSSTAFSSISEGFSQQALKAQLRH